MYAQVDKPKENKSRAVANSVAQKKSNVKQGFGLVDNRLESKEIIQLQKVFTESVQCVPVKKKAESKNKTNGAKKALAGGVKKPKKAPNFYKRIVKGLPEDRVKYVIGQHGAKSREQKRLKKLKDKEVSGATHESEHTIGYAVLSGGFLPRGESKDAQVLENIAPAYQEVKALHRDHIGTGSSLMPDETNMNANQYRDMQRGLLTGETAYHKDLANRSLNPIGVSSTEERNAVSNAVQINQLGYGQQLHSEDEKRDYSHVNPAALAQANDSYEHMVRSMQSVMYAKDANNADSAAVFDSSKLEMILARYAAITGIWPKDQAIELNELLMSYENTGNLDTGKIEQVISLLKP
jgi:hypothetical protein